MPLASGSLGRFSHNLEVSVGSGEAPDLGLRPSGISSDNPYITPIPQMMPSRNAINITYLL